MFGIVIGWATSAYMSYKNVIPGGEGSAAKPGESFYSLRAVWVVSGRREHTYSPVLLPDIDTVVNAIQRGRDLLEIV